MVHRHLVGVLVVLVIALILTIWLTHFAKHSPKVEQYYIQIWLPILLVAATGIVAGRISRARHMCHKIQHIGNELPHQEVKLDESDMNILTQF